MRHSLTLPEAKASSLQSNEVDAAGLGPGGLHPDPCTPASTWDPAQCLPPRTEPQAP